MFNHHGGIIQIALTSSVLIGQTQTLLTPLFGSSMKLFALTAPPYAFEMQSVLLKHRGQIYRHHLILTLI